MQARLLTTTTAAALSLALLAGPGMPLAQETVPETTAPATSSATTTTATDIDAEKLIGRNITNPQDETVGQIKSAVIDQDGKIRHVIVGVGGLLGIGERNVALPWDSLVISENGEKVVANVTREQLEVMPEHRFPDTVTGGVYSYEDDLRTNPYLADATPPAAGAGTTAGNTAAAPEPAVPDTTTNAAGDPAMTQPDSQTTTGSASTTESSSAAAQGDGTTTSPETGTLPAAGAAGTLRATALVGADVENAAGERIGEIGEILLGSDGAVDGVVIDVGGFLGMGERPVMIAWQDISISNTDNTVKASTHMTREQIDLLPPYQVSTVQ